MRKASALKLIKLAHRIYPPRVTEIHVSCLDPVAAAEAVQRIMARRESRGWN